MMYFDFEAGNKAYKLRLSTRNVVALEKKLGCNPVAIFGNGETIPTISTMVTVLHSALQQYHHGITIDDAYDIYDAYLADGHTMTDFIPVIVEIYRASGIIKQENSSTEEDSEKN
jgi:hypothetical protein